MFTIEHDFDATIVTLVDEGQRNLREDVVFHAFEDRITIRQYDASADRVEKIVLSMRQARDLAAALDLPEGIYRLATKRR
ncbi:MAG: hypothetical protein ACC619_10755 [Paracoccaceae bacterium]